MLNKILLLELLLRMSEYNWVGEILYFLQLLLLHFKLLGISTHCIKDNLKETKASFWSTHLVASMAKHFIDSIYILKGNKAFLKI